MPPDFSIAEFGDALKLIAGFTVGALAAFSGLCVVLAEEMHVINLF
jgi:hypothetical protein